MDSEEKELIRRTLDLTEENNKILRKMHSSMKWGRVLRVFYWVLVIGISIGALYYVQPYINQLLEVYSGLQSNLDNVNSVFKSFNAPR